MLRLAALHRRGGRVSETVTENESESDGGDGDPRACFCLSGCVRSGPTCSHVYTISLDCLGSRERERPTPTPSSHHLETCSRMLRQAVRSTLNRRASLLVSRSCSSSSPTPPLLPHDLTMTASAESSSSSRHFARLQQAVQRLTPLALAETKWDNVGIMVEAPEPATPTPTPRTKVVCCIDRRFCPFLALAQAGYIRLY